MVSREALIRYRMSDQYKQAIESLVRQDVQQRLPQIQQSLDSYAARGQEAAKSRIEAYKGRYIAVVHEEMRQYKRVVDEQMPKYTRSKMAEIDDEMPEYKRSKMAEIDNEMHEYKRRRQADIDEQLIQDVCQSQPSVSDVNISLLVLEELDEKNQEELGELAVVEEEELDEEIEVLLEEELDEEIDAQSSAITVD